MTENGQQDVAWNMSKYRLSLVRIFPYVDRIISVFSRITGKYGYNSAHIKENMDQRKPVFWHIRWSKRTGVGC